MKTLAPLSLAATLLLSSAPLAWALPAVDEATATKLAGQIDSYLAGALAPYMHAGVRLDGKTALTPKGEAYTLTLPVIMADMGPTAFRSGAITGTLTPMDDTHYAFTLLLPAGLGNFTDIAGTPVVTATLDTQDIKGVWEPGKDLLTSLTANLGNIVFNVPKEKVTIGARGVAFAVQNSVDSGNRLAMSSLTTVKNFSILGQDSNITVGEGSFRSTSSGMDYAVFQKAREQTAQAGATSAKLPGLMETLASANGKYSVSSELSNILLTYNTAVNEKAGSWKVGKATFGSEGAVAEGGLADLTLSFGHEGLVMDPVPSPALGAVLPTQAAFKIDMSKLPMTEILKAIADEATGTGTASEGGDTFRLIREALGKAGSEIRLTQAGMKSPSLASTLAGALVADAQSKFGFIGTLDGKLTGVDELVTKIGQMTAAANSGSAAGGPVAQADPTAQGLLMALSIIQTQGTPVPNSTPSVRRYVFDLGKGGTFKLNGVDLGMMLGINTAAQPPQQPSATVPEAAPPSAPPATAPAPSPLPPAPTPAPAVP